MEIHLSGLARQGLINAWHDRRIIAGQDFADQINSHFANADIVLLLISPEFIASDYCYEIEMKNALNRHENKEAVVIPIILRPCDWHDLPFGKLLAATKDGKPITHFPSYDDGFLEVVKSIKAAIKNHPNLKEKGFSDDRSVMKQASALVNPNLQGLVERSSNLRIKRGFTDREKDQAKAEVLDYVFNYFENSLQELVSRNEGIEVEFRRIDANSFEAAIYVQGKRKSKCGIWIGTDSLGGDVYFHNGGISRNSYNECMTLSDDGYSLGFKPIGMGFRTHSNQLLNNEGVAEFFWNMLVEPLQY